MFFAAVVLFSGLMLYSNWLVSKMSADEKKKIEIWADAIQQKALLVNYTNEYFDKVIAEEKRRAQLLAKAYNKLVSAPPEEDLTFYLEIISNNKTIPCIITDETSKITGAVNVDFNTDTVPFLTGKLKEDFSVYKPIAVNYYKNKYMYLYYKESNIYSDLRKMLNNLIKSFFNEVVDNSASVPVIVTDSSKSNIIAYGNIDTNRLFDQHFIAHTISQMESENKPIEITISGYGKSFVFFQESSLLKQLRYFPIIQFFLIGLFIIIAYILFSAARKAEQNQVWVGMSKETAHQLGTPISSLIGWVEILKLQEMDAQIVGELQKDINRLETIAQRFSKIGSIPELKEENLVEVITDFVKYLKTRSPKNIEYKLLFDPNTPIPILLNKYLFEWVIENLCKNAIDSMEGPGFISISVFEEKNKVYIDVSDSGKGIDKKNFKTIFKPGYTSKKRGWGLGLSLSSRIVTIYHKGQLYVKNSTLGEGTTFRIRLNK
jgi:signal transduction histidine kinase